MCKISRKEAIELAQETMKKAENDRIAFAQAEAQPYLDEQKDLEELLDILQRMNRYFYVGDEYECDVELYEDIQKALIKHGRSTAP